MRIDSILMVLGVAVVATATYFILETTVAQRQPELASVTPDQPPVVVQGKAEEDPEAEENVR